MFATIFIPFKEKITVSLCMHAQTYMLVKKSETYIIGIDNQLDYIFWALVKNLHCSSWYQCSEVLEIK